MTPTETNKTAADAAAVAQVQALEDLREPVRYPSDDPGQDLLFDVTPPLEDVPGGEGFYPQGGSNETADILNKTFEREELSPAIIAAGDA